MADDESYVPPDVPRRGDELFSHDRANWRMDALLDFNPGNSYTYRQGYKRAGQILTQWVSEHGEPDFLVFPICHAYRHYVELSLKHLMRSGCHVIGREMTTAEAKLQNGSHNLRDLWESFKIIDAELSEVTNTPSPPQPDMDGIDAYIDQLHIVDEGSFSFRYPLTKRGEISLGDIKRINLARFSSYMERLCAYLDGFDAYYGHLHEMGEDMRSDWQ